MEIAFDYNWARPIGNTEWEEVIDADSPLNDDGTYAGPEDVFKLAKSGWKRHIEFKPKGE